MTNKENIYKKEMQQLLEELEKVPIDLNLLDGTKELLYKTMDGLSEFLRTHPQVEEARKAYDLCVRWEGGIGKLKTMRHKFQLAYCMCNELDDGRPMILCDNTFCAIGRYHFECVDITEKPHSKWYCPICVAEKLIKEDAQQRDKKAVITSDRKGF